VRGQDHRGLREQLGAYALGQLTGEELGVVRAHLQTCAACRGEVAALVPVAAALRTVDPDRLDQAPPAAPPLSAAVLQEVRSGRGAPSGPGRSRRVGLLAAAVVAVVAAAGIGYGLGVDAATLPAGEPVAVQAMAPQLRANATLIPHSWGMEVTLTGTGFAPGEAYRVSVTDRAGRTVSAGEFLGTGGAEMRCNLNSSVLRTDAASVQVRDLTGDVVLAAVLR